MQSKGFTLVELLVVVGIIGVLASVSIVSVNSVRQKGRDAKRISEVKELQNGMEAYYSSNNSYPVGLAANTALVLGKVTAAGAAHGDTSIFCINTANGGNGFGFTGIAADCVGTPFMQRVPLDTITDYTYKALQCAGVDGAILAPCSSYEIKATLESGTGSFKAGVITASPNGIIGS